MSLDGTGAGGPELGIDWDSIRDWLTFSLGRGWRITALSPMAGATSSTLVAADASRGDVQVELVLRLYTNRLWLDEVPDVPAREATNLVLAGQVPGMAVPRMINVDAWGGHCRYLHGDPLPALLMKRMPGQVKLPRWPDAAYLRGLVEAIAPLHDLDGASHWRTYAPYADVNRLEAPTWSAHPELWARIIGRVQEPWPEFAPRFIHRDYHMCNVIWQGDAVSGVIDWSMACRGPLQIDAAWCRFNLMNLYGVEAANAYTTAWREVEGHGEAYDPFWDMIVFIEGLPGGPEPYEPWALFGGPRVTRRDIIDHREAWVQQLAAAL